MMHIPASPLPKSSSGTSIASTSSNSSTSPRRRTRTKCASTSMSHITSPLPQNAMAPSTTSVSATATSGARQNVVVCVRMRPSAGDAESDEIWSVDRERNKIAPTESHPVIARRAGFSSAPPGSTGSASVTALPGAGGLDDDEEGGTYDFRFDSLLLHPEPTSSMYQAHIAPVVRAAMDGFNGTVFAYGQTGSGKTHTMSGTEEEPGVIPAAIEQVFNHIEEEPDREFLLRISYLEIYNETLRDLLASPGSSSGPTSSGSSSPTKGNAGNSALRIMEDKGRIVITGLKEEIVSEAQAVLDTIARGERNRHVGSTDWNERSSRSHCVFQMTIESRERVQGETPAARAKTGKEVRVSQLNLIDLAGSERAASQAERRKEGAFINKSLLTLGSVIAKLTEPSAAGGSAAHIPYRDSKLTRLLQTSLSGNARVAVVCTISPDARHGAESISTLKFGRRCKMVVTTAQRGTVLDDKALIQKYRRELDELRAKLEAGSPQPELDVGATEGLLGASQEEKRRLEELASERAKAEQEVAEMQVRRTDLRAQVDHLTKLILTSQSVADERKARAGRLSLANVAPSEGGSGRRGPRLSDMGLSLGMASRSSASLLGPGGLDTPRRVVSGGEKPSLGALAESPERSKAPNSIQVEAELASLRRELNEALEARLASDAAHWAQLEAERARAAQLEADHAYAQRELDEAEEAYKKLREERDAARELAKKEQAQAEKARELAAKEQEGAKLFKLVAQSRTAREGPGASVEAKVLMKELENAKSALEKEKKEKDAVKEELRATVCAQDESSAERDFHEITRRMGSAEAGDVVKEEARKEVEAELAARLAALEERERSLEERERKSAPRPLPDPEADQTTRVLERQVNERDDKLRALEERLGALERELKAKEAEVGTTPSHAERMEDVVELQMTVDEQKAKIEKLETDLAKHRPLPVPRLGVGRKTSLETFSLPGSPIKGSRLRSLAQDDTPLMAPPGKGGKLAGSPLARGGSVREYRRYTLTDDVFSPSSSPAWASASGTGNSSSASATSSAGILRGSSLNGTSPLAARAEREEIARLNAVISSQRALMADLERSVAGWKNRLRVQQELIARLAEGGLLDGGADLGLGGTGTSTKSFTPPMPDSDLGAGSGSPTKLQEISLNRFEHGSSRESTGTGAGAGTSISRAVDALTRASSTASRSHSPSLRGSGSGSGSSNLGSSSPYYGAHTYNRAPAGLGLAPASPTKGFGSSGANSWLSNLPGAPDPLPLPPSSPSSEAARARRARRQTIDKDLEMLKASPRVEASRTRLLESPGKKSERRGMGMLPVLDERARTRDYYI